MSQGGVEVVALEQVVAREELLRLRERTVGDLRLAAARTHGGGALDRLERRASEQRARVLQALRVLGPGLHRCLGLAGGRTVDWPVDQKHVLRHFVSLGLIHRLDMRLHLFDAARSPSSTAEAFAAEDEDPTLAAWRPPAGAP